MFEGMAIIIILDGYLNQSTRHINLILFYFNPNLQFCAKLIPLEQFVNRKYIKLDLTIIKDVLDFTAARG